MSSGFPTLMKPMECPCLAEQHDESAEEKVYSKKKGIYSWIPSSRKHPRQRMKRSDESNIEENQHDECFCEKLKVPLRTLSRVHRESKWFSINAMPRSLIADESSMKEALEEKDKEFWKDAIRGK